MGARAIVLLALAFSVITPAPARATDPVTALGNAEATANEATAEISELRVELGSRKSEYGAVSKRASAAREKAADAEEDAAAARSQIEAVARAAQHNISAAEARYDKENEGREEDIATGVAGFVAATVIALLALAWGWFRASAPVAWLTERGRSQALGLTFGGALVLVTIGGALLGGNGVSAVVGGTFVFVGLIMPVAFLLARHSANIQRGRSRPLMRRDRMPRWVSGSLAAVFGVLALLSLGSAVFASNPDAPAISVDLRAEAGGDLSQGQQQRLTHLEAEEKRLIARASRLRDREKEKFKRLATTRRQLRRARRQLARAETDVSFYGKRLAVVERREARRAEREVRLAAETAEEEAAEDCHPSYSGCLDPTVSDYDCEGGSGDGPSYTGTVTVIGPDDYGLDSDGDGIGCEP